MSKALVIKGVSFSENALTQVVFSSVPCTGITLDQETVSTMVAVQLTATVTPVDTTDPIIWSSSDTDIATVSNGLVTPAGGVGEVVITARCGEQTAACTFTISKILEYSIMNDEWIEGAEGESAGLYIARTAGIGSTAGTYGCFYSEDPTPSGYSARKTTGSGFSGQVYPIMIPKGCTKIVSSGVPSDVKMTERECDSTVTTGSADHAIRALNNLSAWAGQVSNGDRTITLSGSADSLFLNFYGGNSAVITQQTLEGIVLTCS